MTTDTFTASLILPFPECYMASLVAQTVKHLPAMWETWVQSLGQEDPLEKEMATHSSTRAWKTPYMEESGGLPAMGSQRVRQHWVTSISECYMVGFIKYVAFPDWLLLFSNEHLWFLHVFSWLDSSLLLVFYFIILLLLSFIILVIIFHCLKVPIYLSFHLLKDIFVAFKF